MLPWGFNKLMRRSKRLLLDIGRECHGTMFLIGDRKLHGEEAGSIGYLIVRADLEPLQRIDVIKNCFEAFRKATSTRTDAQTANLLSKIRQLEGDLDRMYVIVLAKRITSKKKKASKKKVVRRR